MSGDRLDALPRCSECGELPGHHRASCQSPGHFVGIGLVAKHRCSAPTDPWPPHGTVWRCDCGEHWIVIGGYWYQASRRQVRRARRTAC